MPEPPLDFRRPRRPVKGTFGFLVGVVLGPLIALVYLNLPSSEWLGPYPPYGAGDAFAAVTAIGFGLCYGPLAGAAIALSVQRLQRWWWCGPPGPLPDLHRPRPESQPGPAGADVRISRRTDIADPPQGAG